MKTPKSKARKNGKARKMILLHEKSGCYSDYTLQPNATDTTPATPSPEQKMREAISKAMDLESYFGREVDIAYVRIIQDKLLTRILSALQSSGCLKAEGEKRPPVGNDPATGDGKARYSIVSRRTAFTYAAFCSGRTGRSVNVAEDSVHEFIEAAKSLGLETVLVPTNAPEMPPTSHQPAPSDDAAKLVEIREVIDGYIDGAPDRGRLADVANRIALIIDGPL